MKTGHLVFFFWVLATCALAQEHEIFTKSGAAIGGFDAVAYFRDSTPVRGSSAHQTTWKDAVWLFKSQENLEAFTAEPEKYAPQYGGYCAYGLAEGHTAPTQPDAWTIVDGKLYLNYNKSVRDLWRKNEPEYIRQANKNWPGVLEKQ